MKTKFTRNLISIPVILLFSTFLLNAQGSQSKSLQQISRDSLLNVARIIAESAECRVLITVDESGKPHAREMSPFKQEENWVIWLGTRPNSRKTKQIQQNPNVVVYYYETTGKSYVSISGKAKLVNDPVKKTKYWVDAWQTFYPDRDKDYILIEVIPEILEVFSFKYNLYDPATWKPLSVNFTMQ
jgi:general stress protein 26